MYTECFGLFCFFLLYRLFKERALGNFHFCFFPYRTFCTSVIADLCLTASRAPGKMASSRLLILLALAFSSLSFVLSHSNREMWFKDFFPPNVCPINAKANTFYGIMFDAGSTGTRIHIYTFVQKSPGKTLCTWIMLT